MVYECSVCNEGDGGDKCTINVPGTEKPQCCPVWNNWSAQWKIADCTEQPFQPDNGWRDNTPGQPF